eukprot:m.104630 g.104630  ORF g.104630 m.104630 type:complete len:262 (+) comp37210_c0_seq2:5-790(+)
MKEQVNALVSKLVCILQKHGEKKVKEWWEKYLKKVIRFHGIPMAKLRKHVNVFFEDSLRPLSTETKKEVAFELLKCEISEEKLSGILLFEKLLPALTLEDVPYFEAALRDGHLYEWNNVDWLCTKVLHELASRGKDFCNSIAQWTNCESGPVWLRRAGVVAFVRIASRSNYEGFVDLALTAAVNNLRSKERFVQTGTGWMLRELAKFCQGKVVQFIEQHVEMFTKEGLSYATEKMPVKIKKKLVHLLGQEFSKAKKVKLND